MIKNSYENITLDSIIIFNIIIMSIMNKRNKIMYVPFQKHFNNERNNSPLHPQKCTYYALL